MSAKTSQLQIRVTPEEKRALKRLATDAGISVSRYVLASVLPSPQLEFARHVQALRGHGERPKALSRLRAFLSQLSAEEITQAIADVDVESLPPILCSYVAATVEEVAQEKRQLSPRWVKPGRPLGQAALRVGTTESSAPSHAHYATHFQAPKRFHRCSRNREQWRRPVTRQHPRPSFRPTNAVRAAERGARPPRRPKRAVHRGGGPSSTSFSPRSPPPEASPLSSGPSTYFGRQRNRCAPREAWRTAGWRRPSANTSGHMLTRMPFSSCRTSGCTRADRSTYWP